MSKLDANEPIRRNVYVAAAIAVLATVFGMLAVADPITAQKVFAALAVGLGEAGALWGGTERARDKAWGPKSVDNVMDAEAVIRAAENGEHDDG